MAYNIIDIIEKAIIIDENSKNTILSAAVAKLDDPRIGVMSKVFIEQLNKSIYEYNRMKLELMNGDLDDIDFMSYDKISFLFNEFNEKKYSYDIDDIKDFMKFVFDLAKEKYSLFIDIQGRLVNNTGESNTKTYEILSVIIEDINKQIISIEKVV